MVRVKFIASAQRHAEEIVNDNTTVRDYLTGKNAMMSAHFTANGAPISDKLNLTFKELVEMGVVQSGATIQIYETIKTSNAAC